MSEENTPIEGGGEALPAAEVPNDAEVEQTQGEPAKAEPKKEDEAEVSRKKNRTREYINRINAELAEWRTGKRSVNPPQPSQPSTSQQDGEPTLEQFNFDPVAFQRAHSDWAVQKALKADRETRQQEEQQRRQQDLHVAYSEKALQFADEHPDFLETVGSIPYVSDAVQLAIMGHENGPAIAYHIAQNDDLVLQLASIPPQLAASAIAHIASRMTAAPQAPQTPQAPVKPVSKAPAPVPTVSGKTPTETPEEKLTDAQWFARARKKQAS